MLRSSGRRVDLSSPFVDATLQDGSRLHVVIPDITKDHWHVNIRKFVVKADHLDDLVRLGTVTRQAAKFLEACVVAGLNILVAGGTQAGKTTFLNCLSSAIPSRERVVTCEEVFELKIPLRDVASMQCRQPSLEGTGEVPLRRLVKEALRMRPSRIIVGEVRQAESLDLLIALNSGLPLLCAERYSMAWSCMLVGVAGPVQRPKAPWLPRTRPTWSTSKPTTLPSTESRNPYRTGGESGALHSRGWPRLALRPVARRPPGGQTKVGKDGSGSGPLVRFRACS